MPKIQLQETVLVDFLIVGAYVNFILDVNWPSCVAMIAVIILKGVSMTIPKSKDLAQGKINELEEKLQALKKELTGVKLKIGLES